MVCSVLAHLFGLNYLSTRSFGESEYVFSSIKVITVFVFLFCGSCLSLALGHISRICELDCRRSSICRWIGIYSCYLYGGRILLQGTELIGVAAGEAENPEKRAKSD